MSEAVYYSGNLRDVFTAFRDKPKWLIEPYLPVEGIVLLHGKFSLGKSPLIWKIGQCVSEGIDFFGCTPERTGSVVYIEIDEPLVVTQDRLKKLDPMPRNVHVIGMEPFSVLNPSMEDEETLQQVSEDVKPSVVLVNSLRKCHTLDSKDDATPSRIYGKWKKLFPKTCLVFVHHDKKSDVVEGKRMESSDEDFSGSQAWVNDAQIALHLKSAPNARRTRQVTLEMTKSQLSALQDPLRLRLADDGVNWVDVGTEAIRETFNSLDPSIPKMSRYEITAEKCKVGVTTVRRILNH